MELENRSYKNDPYNKEDDDIEDSTSQTTDMSSSSTKESWGNQLEFLLSIIGFTVGIGSIWRFPYMCYRNGGGAFFIPFVIFLVLWGAPMYYMELCLGQFSGKSTIQVFDFCPLLKGVGIVMIIAASICIISYGVVFAWIMYYLFRSFYPKLGWTSCDNEWNTPRCIVDRSQLSLQVDGIVNTSYTGLTNMNTTNLTDLSYPNNVTGRMATEEFWMKMVLDQTSGIEDFGRIQWHIVLSSFVFWAMVFLCIMKGVKSVGKVVYVTVTLPYILLIALLVRGLTLDGGWEGVKLYLYPDFHRLLDAQIWVEASLQVFYSLGPGWGSLVTMSSFNKFNANTWRSSVICCFADIFTAFLCGLVVFAMIGVLSNITGDPIDKLPFSGPGLAFIVYPEALGRLPFPHVWSVLFFVTLILTGIDSNFGMMEAVINSVLDIDYRRLGRYRTSVTLLISVVFFLVGCVGHCSNAVYIFQLVDWYVAVFNITVSCFVEGICVAWIYGVNRFSSDIVLMTGQRSSIFMRIAWSIIGPLFMMTLVILAIVFYAPPNGQNGYIFPPVAVAVGNMIALFPILAIPGYAVYDLWHRHGSLWTRIKSGLTPNAEWQPKAKGLKEEYLSQPYHYETRLVDRALVDMLGLKSKSG